MSKVQTHVAQLRDQPVNELEQALAQTRDELFRLQLGQYTNQVTSTAAIATKRRDIARILTILRGRELGLESQAAAKKEEAPAADEAPAKKKSTRKAKAKS